MKLASRLVVYFIFYTGRLYDDLFCWMIVCDGLCMNGEGMVFLLCICC